MTRNQDILAFQDELDSLIAAPAPRLLRLWPALGAALLAALIAAAAATKTDIVVTASGRLASESPPVLLQPIDRAILRELHVQPGQRLAAGQLVAVLDQSFTAADRAALAAQRRALIAQRDRLEAEAAGTSLPTTNTDAALQADVQTQRAALHAARLASHNAEIAALLTAQSAERQSAPGLADQLAIAAEVEAMRGKLLDAQVGSRLSLLAARAARLDAERELSRHRARLDDLALRLAARTAERDAFVSDWQRQAAEDLARLRPDLARIEEQLAKAERLDTLTELRAPTDSIVLEVARRAPGSLMREGEPIATLAPAIGPLIAELALRSADTGRLHAGAPVRLKIDAHPWRRHGTLSGTLRSVSRESYPDQNGNAVHRAQIAIGTPALKGDAPLLPGMTLSAEIITGTRSVLDFFLDPLLRGLDESLREP